jgi:hypothetical protein
MKLPLSISLVLLMGCFPSLADQENKRFVEFQQRGLTETYDLSTVHILQPGRFSIVSTSIDDADVLKLKLKVLDTLRTYCKQPNGKYLAPTDLLTLGPPDMEIENIEVQTVSRLVKGGNGSIKFVFWHYPYDRLALHTVGGKVTPMGGDLRCTDDEESYFAQRTQIMSGIRTKELFDCKSGLMGNFRGDDDDDPFTYFVKPQTYADRVYAEICLRVTHETPHSPE